MRTYLAVDIGASSGRHILGWVEDGRIRLEEVYRFPNLQKVVGGHDCWDIEALWGHILAGLKACRERGRTPDFMGIDTWAVDFVLVDGAGRRVSDAVSYRDARTDALRAEAEKLLPFAWLYERTGIQYQPFNTIYQLLALRREHPEQLEAAERFLMLPDYFHYLLTGRMENEYTNATSTALVSAHTGDWDGEILSAAGLPRKLFGPLRTPGTVLGRFTEEVQREAGFDCTVILPATHDTGSAFLAVPARDENAVYLSSGTWSLLGVETGAPITSAASAAANFTNEGGYDRRFRYLKNIMGLWMIQSIRRELSGLCYVAGREERSDTGREWTFPDLIAAAAEAEGFPSVVNANDERFLAPVCMAEAVKSACAESGQSVPGTVGELMQCVYRSLAECYRSAVEELRTLTGRAYTNINIVGGGCQDGYLNRLTARATGLPVLAGPVEGTALGNLMAQMLACGEFHSPAEARAAVRRSFTIKEVHP